MHPCTGKLFVSMSSRYGMSIECFHMTSRRPYWYPKTMKRRPCWCPKPILWELNSFLMQTLSFVPINLHRCWPREWKHSIGLPIIEKYDVTKIWFYEIIGLVNISKKNKMEKAPPLPKWWLHTNLSNIDLDRLRSTFMIGTIQFHSVTEIAPNHCSFVCTKALSDMVYLLAKELSVTV